ncbi:MAG TPA: DUF1345 domain-containing protein [Burkholderiaceae bacterium]|nr:DUF1345 domain-containing protein [Burkholderiaceae bacterium]
MTLHNLHGLHWSARITALQRQALALGAALLTGFAAARWAAASEVLFLAPWLTYCAVLLGVTWHLAAHLDAHATRRRAQYIDPGAAALFVLVAAASCASIAAVALAVDSARSLAGWARWAHLTLAMASLAASWLLMQAMFALHYARDFYRPAPSHDEPARGLVFPGGQDPDDLDFLYFAAVVGMTSQVSDVAVASRRMRRLTLLHGLLSFAFNLVFLALAVNVFAGSLA